MNLPEALAREIHGEVATDAPSILSASRDTSLFEVMPKAVVHPMNTQDVSALVRYVSDHPGTSLTVRGAGTDMTGGPLTESIVVDMSTHFTRIGEIHDSTITVEPGVYYKDMEKKTLLHNLLMPSYPASKDICTVGGMVNNNAGGEKTLLYGKTDRYISELNVVLSDGNEYTLRPLSRQELMRQMEEKTFLGTIYRSLFTMLEKNYDVIQHARPNVSKNSAGYALWNVWDKTTFDMTKLFAGSQGTLGITTGVEFRLIRPHTHKAMLIIFLRSLAPLADIISRMEKYRPESFESYDDHTLSLVFSLFPSFVRSLKTNIFSLGLQLFPAIKMALEGGLPKLILMAEFTGNTEDEVRMRVKAAQSAIAQFHVVSHIASTEKEQHTYWTIRRESFNILRHTIRKKTRTAPFIDDLIVHPKHLPEFLPKLGEILEKYGIDYSIAGHVGDGNFHIIPLMDLHKSKERALIPKISKEVYALVFSFRGSSTAEHNDGLSRSYLLPEMYGPYVYALFKETKRIFDPKGIFNPGKKVGASWNYSEQHIAKN